MPHISADTRTYNTTLKKADREIVDILAQEISRALPKAENKVWHGSPVWFLDGNPIVGYGKLKGCVRLLFWSGQSFQEKGLQNEGSFKAAEVRYTDAAEIDKKDLKRWLKKAQDIQWDYKNIVKRKGVLKKVERAVPAVSSLKEGDRCVVIGGTHAGKSGIARDIKTSKTGQLTLTVQQANGERFKTLVKNVVSK